MIILVPMYDLCIDLCDLYVPSCAAIRISQHAGTLAAVASVDPVCPVYDFIRPRMTLV